MLKTFLLTTAIAFPSLISSARANSAPHLFCSWTLSNHFVPSVGEFALSDALDGVLAASAGPDQSEVRRAIRKLRLPVAIPEELGYNVPIFTVFQLKGQLQQIGLKYGYDLQLPLVPTAKELIHLGWTTSQQDEVTYAPNALSTLQYVKTSYLWGLSRQISALFREDRFYLSFGLPPNSSHPSNMRIIADVRPKPGSRLANHVEKIWPIPQYLISSSVLQQINGLRHGIPIQTLSKVFANWYGIAVHKTLGHPDQIDNDNGYYFIQKLPRDGGLVMVVFTWDEPRGLPIVVSAHYLLSNDLKTYGKFRGEAGTMGKKFNYP